MNQAINKTINRIEQLFQKKPKDVLNIFFTAGYPTLNSTASLIKNLEKAGADMLEIGMPYSDPLADGLTIQKSSEQALKNGMSLKLLFEQLSDIRQTVKIPLLLMGYFNQLLQYGVENFCKSCVKVGVDGLIIPDLPPEIYEQQYQALFEKYGLNMVFLITPQTSETRIQRMDVLSKGFLYMVSSASVTGAKSGIENKQIAYFERIAAMNLQNPRLIGFGIADHQSFKQACGFANGAIIGSAFIRALENVDEGKLAQTIETFVRGILKKTR